jgi:alginate O-acetyltransferase complex protein AlgI
MLFNSPEFIFAFLPVVLVIFFWIAARSHELAAAWLTSASIFFYGWWNAEFVVLLLASITFNYGMGYALSSTKGTSTSRVLLITAIGVNVSLLLYFKYVNFFIDIINDTTPYHLGFLDIVLPLGISFFTFTQIAFLVDTYRGIAHEYSFSHYALFVSYFPHLIAGPVLHHKEMMPQFAAARTYQFNTLNFVDGTTLFLLGLFKKVVLADRLGVFASSGFYAAASGHKLGFFEAWSAVLCYTLQIYFDFSGYSDMAVGLGRMFNIELPINFFSPYKARSITEFWRRWHITLSRFLRDYLYIPLGGSRRGNPHRYANLMATMLIGGLWHGAGWTFIIWGGLHGVYLVINHAWDRFISFPKEFPGSWITDLLSWSVTFFAVVLAWVFFRADTLHSAISIIESMFGLHGSLLPDQIISFLPILSHVAKGAGTIGFLADGTVMGFIEMTLLVTLCMMIVLFAPNLYQLSPRTRILLLIPTCAMSIQAVLFSESMHFLYFQF